jgi:dihydroxy-acid dehydratase
VQDGDPITLDIPNRKLDINVRDAELVRRRSQWKRPAPADQRGYLALYRERVTQAHEGCDFDFLEAEAAPSRSA